MALSRALPALSLHRAPGSRVHDEGRELRCLREGVPRCVTPRCDVRGYFTAPAQRCCCVVRAPLQARRCPLRCCRTRRCYRCDPGCQGEGGHVPLPLFAEPCAPRLCSGRCGGERRRVLPLGRSQLQRPGANLRVQGDARCATCVPAAPVCCVPSHSLVRHAHVSATAPVRLEESWLDESGVETKLMTYEFVDVDTSSIVSSRLGRHLPPCAPLTLLAHTLPQPESTFQLPEPWTHDTCTRNQAGFPYLHLFHHYLRV